MHHHLNKNCTNKGKTTVKVPELKILCNKRKHKRRKELGLSCYQISLCLGMKIWKILGSVNDSKEGGLEELEEGNEGAGEGGHDSSFGGAPLPKHLGQVSGNHCSIASGWGPICQY